MRLRLLAALLVGVTGIAVVRGLAGNGFPYQDHWDEPLKVDQIREGRRDYHHPPLMLDVAAVASRAVGANAGGQRIAEIGRLLSAVYVGIAIGAMALLAFRLAGLGGAVAASILLLADPWIDDAAHSFKEDAILLAGVALALLAATHYLERPTRRRLVGLAVACGFAGAAKLAGLLVVPLALVAVAARPPPGRSRTVAFVSVLGLSLLAFGLLALHPTLWHFPHAVIDAQSAEWRTVWFGRTGRETVPNLGFVRLAAKTLGPATLFFFPVFALVAWGRRPSERVAWLPCLVFPLLFTLLLSLQALVYARYFLPARAAYLTGAGVGLALGVSAISRVSRARLRRGLWVGCALLMGLQLYLHVRADAMLADGRAHTTRAALRTWVRARVPAGAVIAQDFSVRLRDVPQRVVDAARLPELGTVSDLARRGITHVAVDAYWYRAHLQSPADAARTSPDVAFCRDLQRSASVLLALPMKEPYALNPGLLLFALRGSPDPAPSPPADAHDG